MNPDNDQWGNGLPVYHHFCSQVTKLVDNYRSHIGILRLPSLLFYHDELVVKGDPKLTHTFCDWQELPNTQVPVIFHGVRASLFYIYVSL